jgi:hypothetical protein
MKLKKKSGTSNVGRQVNRSIIAATIPLRSPSPHIRCSGRHLQLVYMCLEKMKPAEL